MCIESPASFLFDSNADVYKDELRRVLIKVDVWAIHHTMVPAFVTLWLINHTRMTRLGSSAVAIVLAVWYELTTVVYTVLLGSSVISGSTSAMTSLVQDPGLAIFGALIALVVSAEDKHNMDWKWVCVWLLNFLQYVPLGLEDGVTRTGEGISIGIHAVTILLIHHTGAPAEYVIAYASISSATLMSFMIRQVGGYGWFNSTFLWVFIAFLCLVSLYRAPRDIGAIVSVMVVASSPYICAPVFAIYALRKAWLAGNSGSAGAKLLKDASVH